ncbi:uncharacterized protein F4817DRAFT_170837 [Daldinia loculata]|uniref:uncharacterized protein n=1 Tax=Daldinia loculata TaxID=103429 RepID=UPI0020C28FB6|nr:uncharacterized protein F4817DRAFT_170837 [Daldinia loculata]KAI1645598.1 hypothetical protein F4817DRAFT_170837 [Daldinia loculata]
MVLRLVGLLFLNSLLVLQRIEFYQVEFPVALVAFKCLIKVRKSLDTCYTLEIITSRVAYIITTHVDIRKLPFSYLWRRCDKRCTELFRSGVNKPRSKLSPIQHSLTLELPIPSTT